MEDRSSSGQEPKPLKETRQSRGIGIRRLSKGAPVAPRTIYAIERGESTPQPETIRKISRFLDVDPMTVAEFKAALEAEGLEGLPEEPSQGSSTPSLGLSPSRPPADEEERELAFADLVRLMRDLGRLDTNRAYQRAFEEEPPQD